MKLIKNEAFGTWTSEVCLFCGNKHKGFKFKVTETGFVANCTNCDNVASTWTETDFEKEGVSKR